MRNDPEKPPRNQQVHTCRRSYSWIGRCVAVQCYCVQEATVCLGPACLGPACKWNAFSAIAIARFGESEEAPEHKSSHA